MAKQMFKEVEGELAFSLPKRKIIVKPVIWGSAHKSMIGGKGHSAAWRQDNAKVALQIPEDSKTASLVEPLTEREREYFESDRCPLGYKKGELIANQFVEDQRHNKIRKSYWTRATYSITKTGGIIDEDTVLDVLDLSIPSDYLKYAILRANLKICVAESPELKYHNARNIIVLIDEGEDETVKATKADRIAEAYAHYVTISNTQNKMRELLTVAWMENLNKIKPQKENTLEWLKAECDKIIKLDNGQTYLKVVNNQYEDKAFIFKAVDAGALIIRKDGFATNNDTWIGANLHQAVMYLKNPQNQELLMKIKAQTD
jgi:hypothetical protein